MDGGVVGSMMTQAELEAKVDKQGREIEVRLDRHRDRIFELECALECAQDKLSCTAEVHSLLERAAKLVLQYRIADADLELYSVAHKHQREHDTEAMLRDIEAYLEGQHAEEV